MAALLRKFSFFSLWLVFSALLALEYGWLDFSAPLDQRAGDILLKQHAERRPVSPDVVVIDIDQKSLENLNEVAGSWPWPRAIHAELIDAIARQKPRAIIFDIFFNEPDKFRQDSDAAFRDSVAAHPDVYLPTVLLSDGIGATLAE